VRQVRQRTEVRDPSGQIDPTKDVNVNQLAYVKEGQSSIKSAPLANAKKK